MPTLPALFHPDYDRRLRNHTESAGISGLPETARGLEPKTAAQPRQVNLFFTAGGELRPALRTYCRIDPAYPVYFSIGRCARRKPETQRQAKEKARSRTSGLSNFAGTIRLPHLWPAG